MGNEFIFTIEGYKGVFVGAGAKCKHITVEDVAVEDVTVPEHVERLVITFGEAMDKLQGELGGPFNRPKF